MGKFFGTAYSLLRTSLGFPKPHADAPLSPAQREEQAAFYRAIQADLDDDAPRLMYADWLDEQGGTSRAARAEFIRFQCEYPFHDVYPDLLLHSPGAQEVSPANKLFRRFGAEWEQEFGIGPRGLLRALQLPFSREWRRGFPSMLRDDAMPEPRADVSANCLPFLRNWTCAVRPEDLERFRALVAAGDLANLTHLTLSGDGVVDAVIAALADSPRCPKLLSLTLLDGAVTRTGIAIVLAAPFASQLNTLCLQNCSLGDAEIHTLAGSSSLRKLRRLALDDNPISDEGAIALGRSTHFKSVTYLSLCGAGLGPRGRSALRDSARWRRDCEMRFRDEGNE